ncbi:hypothetical protein CARN8_7060004 [mine drainage metagenome]|uniref:Uncharacterized protein n=1 Tax=mine drainage metagenome TaxID=410659 RepID=A0A3P3ZSC3_9ZZZZ
MRGQFRQSAYNDFVGSQIRFRQRTPILLVCHLQWMTGIGGGYFRIILQNSPSRPLDDVQHRHLRSLRYRFVLLSALTGHIHRLKSIKTDKTELESFTLIPSRNVSQLGPQVHASHASF